MSHPYVPLHSGGTAGERNLYVYLYPNGRDEDDATENGIASALAGVLGDLESFGAIDEWEVNVSYHHPGLPDDDEPTFWSAFSDFIRERTSHWEHKGVHVGVSGAFDFANAEYVEEDCHTAFDRETIATVGIAGSKGRYANFAVQEPLHCAIRYDLEGIQGTLIERGSHMHEHDLGEITSERSLTPMATLYSEDHALHSAREGCAAESSWSGDYTARVTRCTKEAVKITANHEAATDCGG